MAMKILWKFSGQFSKFQDLGFCFDKTILKSDMILISIFLIDCPMHSGSQKRAILLNQ